MENAIRHQLPALECAWSCLQWLRIEKGELSCIQYQSCQAHRTESNANSCRFLTLSTMPKKRWGIDGILSWVFLSEFIELGELRSVDFQLLEVLDLVHMACWVTIRIILWFYFHKLLLCSLIFFIIQYEECINSYWQIMCMSRGKLHFSCN